ncbi:trichothecene C-15 hydroxylase [Colletotrichum spaethianum]|uniref:Trichothecene C-15 hydroxylase n=1 Tax=Colletotrichum spaethianum TaxID=700344 RepID=A0AA37P741_9PEZI|nr:trichothecene C-15 hydroxylase [Colletotrichum spaethianum]GKT41929.1 trichothecene C-15 hydroxylase [Colletotrichum spaethianum]
MEIQVGGFTLSTFILWPVMMVSLVFAGLLLTILYNLTLHPLRKYPGPKLWAATRIPYCFMVIRGNPHKEILDLHKRYDADIIRISPNQLSFQHPDSWKEIMGHRKGKSEENEKDPDTIDPRRTDIISANRQDHARYRRILSQGFSAKSMQDQQPIIKGYIDLFIERLHSLASEGPVDMVSWYNYTTFDIIGDLAFGESFGCLDKSDYHPWVKIIFENVKVFGFFSLARSFKFLEPLLKNFVPKHLVEKGIRHKAFVREKVDRRMKLGTPRPDFAEAMLKKGSEPLSNEEIYENAGILIVAGSETTATALSGATYLLTTNPDKLSKLNEEVRSSFSSEDEIDILSTAKLEYLHAVLEESLRMYPPVPTALPRKTPPRGQEILGQWIPGNTTLSTVHWALYHNEKVFSKPFEFHPERWLGDPAFAGDRLDALKPFHFGPRICLGMNLAYAEMRMMLARVIWNFDLQLASQSQNWIDQECYIIWSKPALMVHLTPRKSG